jgi:uncharacterized protein YoxC
MQKRKAATLEDVWAVIGEIGESHKELERVLAESRKETERVFAESRKELAESRKETDKKMQELAESHKKAEEQMVEHRKETNKLTGDMNRRFGEVVEHLIAPNLIEKLNAMKFDFRISSPNRKYYDKNHQEITEVDVLLENTNIVMAVEVKSKLLASDVRDHVERMNILREYADEHDDKRVWLGAVGGALLATEARKAALKAGFFLIEQSGDTVKISVPQGFKPKEWTYHKPR